MSNKTITIGPGVAHYPAINRPDTKFDELGQYKADVILSAEAAEPFIKTLQARAKAHLGKALPKSKNGLFEMVLNDEGEETGEVLFKIRVKNKTTSAGKIWDRKPMAMDAKMKPMPDSTAIWGGSTIKTQAEIYEWAFSGKKGISLQPLVVQVIDLKTGSGPDLSDFGIEDGYSGDDQSDYAGGADVDTDNSNDADDSDY